MNKAHKAIVLLLVFLSCRYLIRPLWRHEWSDFLLAIDGQSALLLALARWALFYGPFLLCVIVMFRNVQVAELLGVKTSGAGRWLLAACLCCTPMTLGYAYLSTELNLSIADFITGSIYPGLFEEIVFRAALFGALFRYCGWGFIPAALASSLIFGVGHLYQTHDLSSSIAMMVFMAVAGSWFAWLYCESGYRVWFPAGMHILMNGAYGVFVMSGGAMGDGPSNLFKATAIILSIVYLGYVIRKRKHRVVTRGKLWRNTGNAQQPQTSIRFANI